MINDGMEAYEQARKQGTKYVAQAQADHKDPYLPVLDTLLEHKKTAGEMRVGVKDISLSDIAGTKTQARSESFAGNFMPLLPEGSEFASKWVSLYNSQLEEGLRDPIRVFEYMHRYYVQEGNKRVSVMSFLDAPVISASITRILPEKDDSDESRSYYEFLDFAKRSHVDFLHFSKPGSYDKLERLLNPADNIVWSEQQAEDLKDLYARFARIFNKRSQHHLKISLSDAFLLFLEYFGLDADAHKSSQTMEKEVDKIWPELEAWPNEPEVKIITDNSESASRRSILSSLRFDPLEVAFIHSRTPETSSWTAKHEEGRKYVQKLLPTDVKTRSYFAADGQEKELEIMEQAVKDGAEVIFTTSPNMLRSSLKLAAKYPKVKVLNCSLNTKTGQLRTYFARTYEIQFLFGMIAGILTKSDKIGYVADYPIFGMIADINAFALGARMTNPEAKIYLDWSTTKQSMLKDMPTDIDVTYIAGEEFDSLVLSDKEYGLYNSKSGQFLNLATASFYWGAFYLKMIQSILHNGWKKDAPQDGSNSVNYWYGLSNGMLGFHISDNLPLQTRRLIEVMREHMAEGNFNPFSTEMYDQHHELRNVQNKNMDAEDIMHMDWLLDNIVGKIPAYDDFSPDAKRVVRLHGISKVQETKSEDENHENNPNSGTVGSSV